MSADAIGEIPTARWAQLDPATDRLYGELSEAEVPDACELSQARTRDAVLTLGDRMFPTVGEGENAFLGLSARGCLQSRCVGGPCSNTRV
jgi:hypothetical protein